MKNQDSKTMTYRRLCIGGIVIGLESEWPLRTFSSALETGSQDERRLDTFLYKGSRAPDIMIRVRIVNTLPKRTGWVRVFDARVVEDNLPNWTLWRKGARSIFASAISGRRQQMHCSADLTRVQAYLSRDDRTHKGTWTLSEVVFYFLEVHMLLFLAHTGKGFFLHASAVADARDSAFIFAGRSGCGKTTISRLWRSDPGTRVINDERIIVRPQGRSYMVHRTPWFGELSECQDDPVPATKVRALFFLSHGSSHMVGRIDSPAEVRSRFYQVLMWPFWDRKGCCRVSDLSEGFLSRVPSYRLSFAKDASVCKVVRAATGKQAP